MNDLTTMTHEQLTALLATLDREKVEAIGKSQTMRVVNIDHEMSQVRAQLAKVKPKVANDDKRDEQQPKLF
jgi:ribosomal protein L29